MHGQGTLKLTNKSVYVGEFQHSKRTMGTCKYPKESGFLEYVGQWKGDAFHGQGICKFVDGAVYNGEWKENTFDGLGTLKGGPDGKVYVGQWKSGEAHGQGTVKHPDGEEYTGEWKDDLFHGQGTLKLANGRKFAGEWFKGKFGVNI